MLWQPPAPLSSFVFATCRRYSVTGQRRSASEPLRILFCGSDAFSIASLRALHDAKQEVPGLIDSIDVVHRPAKPTGRGLKKLREVPISHTSASLALPTHIIDTFTGWTPPPTNLIIAVSFGLLVPRRILGLAKHGGINVHPSLLPDLRGAAPIEHALLKQRDCTGVSVQTLHPTQYDHGVVLAQSPAPGIRITRDSRFADLHGELAAAGAEMLVDVLKTRKYVAPHRDAGWYAGPVDLAPKILPQDRFVDFGARTMDEVLAMQRALGNTWCVLPNGHRVIMHKVTEAGVLDAQGHAPGMWMREGSENPTLRMACGGLGTLLESTYAGGKKGLGNAKLKMVLPWREAHHDEYNL